MTEESTQTTRRPFNWRLFGLLCTLNVIGAFATLPMSITLMPSAPTIEGAEVPREALIIGIIIVQAVIALILVALTAIGMLLASRVNLGAPIFARLPRRSSPDTGWRSGESAS